jgi:hypothetical protein
VYRQINVSCIALSHFANHLFRGRIDRWKGAATDGLAEFVTDENSGLADGGRTVRGSGRHAWLLDENSWGTENTVGSGSGGPHP